MSVLFRFFYRHQFVALLFTLLIFLEGVPGCSTHREPASTPPPALPPSRASLSKDPGAAVHDKGTLPATKVASPQVYDGIPMGKTADGTWYLGTDGAVGHIEVFIDAECPYCQRFYKEVIALVKKYPAQVQVVLKHFPLAFHRNAKTKAVLAECAGEQNRFWEGMTYVMQAPRSGAPDLAKFAEATGVEVEALKSCVAGGAARATVDKHMREGQSRGVRGTPSLFINKVKVQNRNAGMKKLETMLSGS